MLSGEGNENGEKTTIGLISKKATFYLQHTFFCTFLCCCFARLQRKTSRNYLMVTRFMQEITYMFLFTFFFTAAHFHLGGQQHFSFSYRHYKIFMLFFEQKMYPLFFISCSSSLSFSDFSLSFAGLSPTFSFSLSLYSKFVDMTINQSLMLKTTRILIKKQFALSVFVFIDSLVVFPSLYVGGACDFLPK